MSVDQPANVRGNLAGVVRASGAPRPQGAPEAHTTPLAQFGAEM